jgi:hypothetical protein
VLDLADLDLDGVYPVDDEPTLANARAIAGLHLRNAKAGTRSCTINFCDSSCLCCYHGDPGSSSKK